MKPTILIAATDRWFSTARLAMALANAGCLVEAVCPHGHPLAKTRIVPRSYRYNQIAPLESFANAISATRANLIVPSDDLAARHLHQLYDLERRRNATAPICALIERSLGAPESFRILEARAAIMELAEEEGIRVPRTEVIANRKDLGLWLTCEGFPAVLKVDGTSGGTGVRIVRSVQEAEIVFRTLQDTPPKPHSIIHSWLRQARELLWPLGRRRWPAINAQAFVAGRDAVSEVACWQGAVLASLQFEVLTKQYAGGPSSVLRTIENAEMRLAIERIVRRLNLSGLHGFDFILEEQTGDAHLIEVNPRATQIGHLTLGPGSDLPAALYAAVSGKPLRAAPRITENDVIALFPQEWIRNRTSTYLSSAYHDVPWEEVEFVRACILSCPGRLAPSRSEQELFRELSSIPLLRS